MRNPNNSIVLASAAFLALSLGLNSVDAAVLFSDDFDAGASAAWGNERGNWVATGGVYGSETETNLSYSSVTTLPSLTDFAVELDVNKVHNGGVWLRSSFSGSGVSGALLHTGNFATNTLHGFYWHTVQNDGISGVLNLTLVPGLQGSDVHLRIVVAGDDYSVFLNGGVTPAATFSTNLFASGAVGLYDFRAANPLQTYDNVKIFSTQPVPLPGAALLLGCGLCWLVPSRKRRISEALRTACLVR